MCIQHVLEDNKPCPLCKESTFSTFQHMKLVREVNSLMVYCRQRKNGCDWKGELGKLQEHLDPDKESGCGYVVVSCSCQCGAQVFRHQVREHEMESCPKLSMEVRVTSVVKKFDALHEKLNEVRRAYQGELDKVRQEVDVMKTEHDLLKKQLPVPPFHCTMYNVQDYISTQKRWASQPFYSHYGGYKMKFDVFVTQTSKGLGASLIMKYIVSVTRGEFDSQLKWPFDGDVIIEIYSNTERRWDRACKVELNNEEDSKSISRKTDVLTIQEQTFEVQLSHSEFLNYANQDICWFRVASVNIKCYSA